MLKHGPAKLLEITEFGRKTACADIAEQLLNERSKTCQNSHNKLRKMSMMSKASSIVPTKAASSVRI